MIKVFEERVASERSLSKRKLVQGVGINDAWYLVSYRSTQGVREACPYYLRWCNMLERCYSTKYQDHHPTYVGCSVSKDWLTFSNFRSWMEKQDWVGKQLDKDILEVGNKVYGSSNCLFVSSGLNKLLTDGAAARGEYRQGVSWHKDRRKYRSQCRTDSKSKHLGYFSSEHEAEFAYCVFKSDLMVVTANRPEASSQPQLQEALLREAKAFSDRAELLSAKIED